MFTIDIHERDLYIALCGFILSVLPDVEVVQGLNNGVPMPAQGFISMTTLSRRALSSNHHDYNEQLYSISRHMEYAVQLDCYGKQSSDWVGLISTVLADDYGHTAFPANIKPLYCDDGRQMALVNAEQQYEQRWVLVIYLQFNQTMSRPNENN